MTPLAACLATALVLPLPESAPPRVLHDASPGIMQLANSRPDQVGAYLPDMNAILVVGGLSERDQAKVMRHEVGRYLLWWDGCRAECQTRPWAQRRLAAARAMEECEG